MVSGLRSYSALFANPLTSIIVWFSFRVHLSFSQIGTYIGLLNGCWQHQSINLPFIKFSRSHIQFLYIKGWVSGFQVPYSLGLHCLIEQGRPLPTPAGSQESLSTDPEMWCAFNMCVFVLSPNALPTLVPWALEFPETPEHPAIMSTKRCLYLVTVRGQRKTSPSEWPKKKSLVNKSCVATCPGDDHAFPREPSEAIPTN